MKCDLHCHTSYSYDSWTPPEEMVKAALAKGIDCIAITDHGEIKGAIKALHFALGLPILIIPGIEIKSKEGDILGLNVKKLIPNRLAARETIKRIKEAGGMAILPHPFCPFTGFKGNLEEIVKEIDGIEVLNASIFAGNRKVLALARKFNLPFTCGSDAHFPNFIGRVYLEISGSNLSLEEVLKTIEQKNAKIRGKEANFFEKVIDHSKRNLVKMFKLQG